MMAENQPPAINMEIALGRERVQRRVSVAADEAKKPWELM